MDNGMENMLSTYLYETNSLMEQLDELLLGAEKTSDFTVDDVNEIFRIMHTIKGSSAMMEFNSIMTIAHRIEDVFFYIRENGIDTLAEGHKSELFDLMFLSTDMLRTEVEKVESGQPLSNNIDNITSKINSFLDKISHSSDAAGSEGEPHPEAPETFSAGCPDDPAGYFIRVYFEEGCGMENLRAFMLLTTLKDETGLTVRSFPNHVETDSSTCAEIIENGFLIAIDNEEDIDRAISSIKHMNSIRSYEVLERPEKDEEEEAVSVETNVVANTVIAPVSAVAVPVANSKPVNGPVKQNLISVNLSKLDDLMAIVGEIVITESMVTSSPEIQNLKLDSFTKAARQLRKLTDDLQDISMSLRMISISGVFQKMNRIVRDMNHKLGKNARLTIIGADTEVDKTIVDTIGDPIMHIVRNSMDHGIEATEEERIAAGKPAQGEIVLSASHTGSEVIISVADDGYGVDPAKILIKARENGILTKPENEYSHKEILALLMAPGFSTNEAVTEFSGRGVGMDVVKKNVESVGGTVSITSELGKGSCITLKIPLTLAIVDGMEFSIGDSAFTTPIANIRQSFKVRAEEVIMDSDGHEIIKCMDQFYPIVRVHELYGIATEVTNIEDGILILVEANDKSCCLFVDDLLGEQQVVVKPLPAYLNSYNIKSSGISGCTILGDGSISIILDIANLYTAFIGTN